MTANNKVQYRVLWHHRPGGNDSFGISSPDGNILGMVAIEPSGCIAYPGDPAEVPGRPFNDLIEAMMYVIYYNSFYNSLENIQ